MIVYHGTTERRARRICAEGFLPKKPSRRVWFADTRAYALRRARTQSRRTRDRAVVLTCEINLEQARKRFGRKRVFHGKGVIAINAGVPVTVLRSYPGSVDTPSSPEELAQWVNHVLGLKRHKGAGRRHPGILRLSSWVVNRLAQTHGKIRVTELLGKARQWLPEFFEEYIIDPERLQAYRKVRTVIVEAGISGAAPLHETDALEGLESPKAERRIHGLSILAEIGDPDLFEWCVMCLEDKSVNVRVAALRTMLLCGEIDAAVVGPLAEFDNKRIRAAAVAVLAKHSGEDAPKWFRTGLTDPCPCVRVEIARILSELDPSEHKSIFSLALHDPNRDVAKRAERLTVGKGYTKWRR